MNLLAFSAKTVAVNPHKILVRALTVGQLKKIWGPEAQRKITQWNQMG